jgi:hypothetical protein
MRVNAACQRFVGKAVSALTLVDKAIGTGKVAVAVIKVWKGIIGVWLANRHL